MPHVHHSNPMPADLAPFLIRLSNFIQIWIFKILFNIQLMLWRSIQTQDKESKPLITRYYASQPFLQVRIFIPKLRKQVEKSALLPLYLDIPGGGFAVGDAAQNDPFCSAWCERTGMLVASLNYTKSPLHPFPTQVQDIAVLARSVIEDSSLPIDKSRVVIGGGSAGGNLAFSSCLMPELKDRIRAIVSYYPIVDWSISSSVKFTHRLDTTKPNDPLTTIVRCLDWGYVPAGQDRKEKLLSPCYAAREELPECICMVGAQYDMLCREARDMIYSLAGRDIPDIGWEHAWEVGTYKWMMALEVEHGFIERFTKGDKCQGVYASVHRWLDEKALACGKDPEGPRVLTRNRC